MVVTAARPKACARRSVEYKGLYFKKSFEKFENNQLQKMGSKIPKQILQKNVLENLRKGII